MGRRWTRWLAAIGFAVVATFGVAACDSDPDQVEQDVEQQVDELEEDLRENTP